MEQEPVYVPSDRLRGLAESVVGCIYTRRQESKEAYIRDRVEEYNQNIHAYNTKWYNKLLRRNKPYITPIGMEEVIYQEVVSMPEELRPNHMICQIQQQYGQLEHEAKDAIISCQYNETVSVSSDFTRGVSHLGIDLGCLRRQPFGFMPRT